MLKMSRILISGLAGGFGILLGIFVLIHLYHFNDEPLVAASVFAYFAVLIAALVSYRKVRIGAALATIALAVSFIEPLIMQAEHQGPPTGDYDTWYVTGNAILLGVVAVRGYQLLAALGGVVLFAEVLTFGGPAFLPRSGIIGAILLISSCIAISIGLQRASADVERIQKETLEVEAQSRMAEVARVEHESRVTHLMNEVLPTLQLIGEGKKLLKQHRTQILELDTKLRDELSGGRLINSQMLAAIAAARSLGAEVVVTDQGGTLRIADDELDELLETAVIAMASANRGDRIRLTAPADGPYVLRLTKTRPGVVTPDLDLKLGEGLV